MSFSDSLQPLLQAWNKLPQVRIAQIVSIVLLLYLANLVSQFIWLLLSPAPSVNTTKVVVENKPNAKKNAININSIKALNLFGQYQKPAVNKPATIDISQTDAPETRLNLTLTGVVAATANDLGAAIIANKGKQQTYGVGDSIDGTRAVLQKVLPDRVLVKNAGKLETLMLDGFKYQKLSATNQPKPLIQKKAKPKGLQPSRKQIDQTNNKQLGQNVASLRRDISQNPAKISDYMRIAPARINGQMKGYRLSPGRNPNFFKQSGLKTGDIAVQLNGLDLTNPQQAAQALTALRENQQIILTIDRGGELTDILFSVAN